MSGAPSPDGFVVVNVERLAAVFDALRVSDAGARPSVARRVLLLALANLCPTSGLVQLDRADLAARLDVTPEALSRAMSTLERFGAIRRERRPVHGRPGSGFALYFCNPSLAWSGDPSIRARWSDGFRPLGCGPDMPADARPRRRSAP